MVGNARIVNRKEIATFMSGMTWLFQIINNIDLNRKVLAEMAVNDAEGFAKLAEVAKAKLA